MRCLACDCALSRKESTRRGATTGDFLDLCDHCYSTISEETPAVENPEFEDENEDYASSNQGV